MVVAGIAYRDLKRSDPDKVDRVVALLKRHPQFNSLWKSQLEAVAQEDRDQLLFMLAARWPDDIRGRNSPFDHPKHHFIDQPFIPPGEPASVTGTSPDSENLVTAFKANQSTLAGSASDADKAVALAWLFHQAGDVHQPLHAVSLFSVDYPSPEGDRGGTRYFIRVTDQSRTVSLHKLWDDFLGTSSRFQTNRNRATELGLRTDMARGTFPQLTSSNDVGDWAKESFEAAKSIVYRHGDLEGTKDRNDGEVLPDDYLAEVQPFASRQAVLGGYRLADLLKGAF